jgi:hypothetical protein
MLGYDDAVDLVCRATGWPVGHVWMRGAESWKSSGAWHDDGPQFAGLKESTAVTDLGSGRGIVAAVLHLEACRFMADLTGLGSTVRQQEAAQAGLVAVVGVPLRRSDQIEAVFEFITTSAVEPDNDLSDALLAVAARSRRKLSTTSLPTPRRTVSLDVEHPVDLAG